MRQTMTIASTLAGFLTIGLCVLLFAWVVPENQVSPAMWPFVFLALAACGWFSWSQPNSPTAPSRWLAYVVFAVLVGLVFLGVDTLLYGNGSGHLVFDLALSGLFLTVALSGLVKSTLASWGDGQ